MAIQSDRPQDELLHQIIRQTVRLVPDSPAVESWDGSFTYRVLAALSRCVARALVAQGVQRGSFIPLLFEKSKWMIVAACGVLEAGGAFVPLDDTHPLTRHQVIMDQTKPAIAIVSAKNAKRFQASGLRVLVVGEASEFAAWDVADMTAQVVNEATDPAYLMYTSGTTGKPKGVVISHRSISNSCINVARQVGFSGEKEIRTFQWASYSFDAWILEVFFTLAHGGCICIPSDLQRLNDLAGAMNALRVTYALFTPSVASQISPDEVPTLKWLAMGGEKASEIVARAWRGKAATIYNLYGPTEVSFFPLTWQTLLCTPADRWRERSYVLGSKSAKVGQQI